MDDEQEYTVNDLVSLSFDQKPVEFKAAFDSIIMGRIEDAIADKKVSLSQSVFDAGPDDFLDDDDDSAEFEDELDFEDDDDNQEEDQDG
jgi:hypothetical protein